MGLQRQGQQRGDGHEEPGRGAAPRGTGRAHVPAAPVRLACAGSVRPASTPVSTCSRGCIPNDPPCLKKILTALASSNQANCDLRTVLRFVAPAACRSLDAGCFADTPFRTFADEGVDRGAPLRGEDLDLGPDVWADVDGERDRVLAPARPGRQSPVSSRGSGRRNRSGSDRSACPVRHFHTPTTTAPGPKACIRPACRPASDSHGGARRRQDRGSDAPGRAPRGRSRSDSPVRTPRC